MDRSKIEEIALWLSTGFLAFLVLFRPLVSGMSYSWSNTVCQIVILLILAVWIAKCIWLGRFSLVKTSLYFPILSFAFFVILSCVYSVNLSVSLKQAYIIIPNILLCFLAINVVKKKKQVFIITACLMLTATAVSLYGIYQYFWGLSETRNWVLQQNMQFPPDFFSRLSINEAFSTFVYQNALAGYLLLILPLCVSLFLISKPFHKTLLGVAAASIVLCLYLTYSQGGWGIFLILFLASILILIYKKFRHKKRFYMLSISVIIGMILFSAMFLKITDRTHMIRDTLGSFKVRLNYWGACPGMVKDFPFGSGIGTFGSIYPKYKIPQAREVQLAHNNFIQLWTETGTLGILSFLLIWVMFFRNWRKAFHIERLKILSAGIYMGCIAFLIHSLVDFGFYVPGISMNVWLFIGMIEAMKAKSEEGSEASGKISGHISAKIIFSIFLVFAVILISVILVKPSIAEIHKDRAIGYLNGNDLKSAEEELETAIQFDNTNSQYYSLLGKTLEQAGRFDGAIANYRKAIKRNEYMPYYHFALGKLLIINGMGNRFWIDSGIKEFEKALELYPTKPFYLKNLAHAYRLMGKNEEASNLLLKAEQMEKARE
ncbi:O-antigen ligase family protein [bacterium]|nr:O-antigen ligase family protein [bacterium]